MQNLASKFMTLSQKPDTNRNQPGAIFGTVSNLSQSIQLGPRFRIGLMPCVSDSDPEAAMGLMTILALLLERWRDVRVYRVFVNYERFLAENRWTLEMSQFTVSDWLIDGLDENVIISGSLELSSTKSILMLEIENDLDTNENNTVLQFNTSTLSNLYLQMPDIAAEIAEVLGLIGSINLEQIDLEMSNVNLRVFLSRVFQWQVNLQLALVDQTWLPTEIAQAQDDLSNSVKALGDKLSAWSVASLVAHSMLPGYGDVAEVVYNESTRLIEAVNTNELIITIIAIAYYRIGEPEQSFSILEDFVSRDVTSPMVWRTLGELKRNSSKNIEALKGFQSAIKHEAVDAELYIRYADLVLFLDFSGVEIDTCVLCDEEDESYGDDLAIWEAIEAYEEAITIDARNQTAILQQILRLIDVDETDERLWMRFDQLVELDTNGERIRQVVDAMENIDNISPAVDVLIQRQRTDPDNVSLMLTLAALYTSADEAEEALMWLESTRKVAEDPELINEIDRLTLEVEDPEFEIKIIEYAQVIDAGKSLKNSDVDYLEEILDRFPTLWEVWLLVARAYLAWDDKQSALETLMDGYAVSPDSPEMVALLSQLLWEKGQNDLAIEYLRLGNERHPADVQILAKLGTFLFDNDQRAEAKQVLALAEAIAPRHPDLIQARARIAKALANE